MGHAGCVDAGAGQGATGVKKSTALVGICIGNVAFSLDEMEMGHAGCVDAGAGQGDTGVKKSTTLVGICIGNVVFIVGMVLGDIIGVTMGIPVGNVTHGAGEITAGVGF